MQLKTIKGGDNKTTLLDFLVKTCEAKCPDVLDLDKDFQVPPTTHPPPPTWGQQI